MATELFMADSICSLKYSVVEGKPENEGVFVAQMKRLQEEIVLSRDWVKLNFHKDVVEAVVRSSCNGGFLPVPSVVISVDDTQLQKVRCIYPLLKNENAKKGRSTSRVCWVMTI